LTTLHAPVLVEETLQHLAVERGGLYVDCTVGLGGHAAAMLQRGATRVIGLDRDREALALAATTLEPWAGRTDLVHADYRTIAAVLDARQIASIDGALADLGVSSLQLDGEGRGFSFRRDEPLDMRMDRSQGRTAADVVRDASEGELADIIWQYGEDRFSRRIARAIVHGRSRTPIRTTGELAALVRRVVPQGRHRIDAATRTFQALRIYVNAELDGLERFLQDAAGRLSAGSRLVVISFHSLEDRIVKRFMAREARGDEAYAGLPSIPPAARPRLRLVGKLVRPTDAEIERNPRARSARLRVAERAALEQAA
jgi:16S rRNA (cytosine1402-N4)-methyltransferase